MANAPTLQTRINAFVAALEGVTDNRVIANRWRAEMRHHQDRTPATIKLYVTKYRNAIRERFGADAPALNYVRHNPDVMAEVRTAYKARVATEHRSLIPMPTWRELREAAIALLDSPDPLEIVAGLLLVTGRRSYEICCTASFDLVPIAGTKGFDRWHLAFSGQAKTRGAAGTKAGETYVIPCLANAPTVRRAFMRFRASPLAAGLAGLDGETFSQRIAHRLNNTAKLALGRYFSDGAPFTPKSLRSLYAEIAFKNFAQPDRSKSAFFADVLGHQEWDLETSLSYFDFYLDDPDEAQRAIEQAQAQLIDAAKLRGDNWAAGEAAADDDQVEPGPADGRLQAHLAMESDPPEQLVDQLEDAGDRGRLAQGDGA
jgi:hypothetical protein